MRGFPIIVVACMTFAGSARAGELTSGKVAVDFAPADGGKDWFASALEQMVSRELSRFHRVILVDKKDLLRTPVDVIVRGKVSDGRVEYEVSDTWSGAHGFHGSVRIGKGMTISVLQQHLGAIVRPIVQSGGLLDQKPLPLEEPPPVPIPVRPEVVLAHGVSPARGSAAPSTGPATPAPASIPSPLDVARLALIALILFVAWPPMLALLLVGRRKLRRVERPGSWTGSSVLIALASVALAASCAPEWVHAWRSHLEALSGPLEVAMPLTGGLLWGAFVLLNANWVLPRLEGIRNVRHDALWPLLKAWFALLFLRAALLLAYVPVLLILLMVARSVGLTGPPLVFWVLPGTGLLCHFWFLSVVDNLALYIDAKLVEGPATSRNPWHATLKKYFRGYLRRNGLDLANEWIDRMLLLPSSARFVPGPNARGVTSYGGGLSRPRILVDFTTRELAIGELPEETEAPERTVNGEALPNGLLLPEATERAKRGWRALLQTANQKRRQQGLAPPAAKGAAPRLIGENATLLGWVVPIPREESVPLIANTKEDYDVVRQLLTEHYAAFEKNFDEDEYDDTDPSHRDFLFGALLREIGALSRRDSRLSTIRLAFDLAGPKTSWLAQRILAAAREVYQRFLSRPAAVIGDAYVALQRGLDPLIQYLDVLRGGSHDLLTARANGPRYYAASREILDAVSREPATGPDRHLLRATPRNRLAWLSESFYAPIAVRSARGWRWALTAVAVLAFGAAVAQAASTAFAYHPVYLERMRAMQAQSVDSQGASDGGQSH